MQYPQAPGTHVFTLHGTDGNRWATCSCNWESEHVAQKREVERLCAEHANENAAPFCPTCEGSGRDDLGLDICGACGGTGRDVA
jgi:hypothetical protein